jgi:hypothetical protein
MRRQTGWKAQKRYSERLDELNKATTMDPLGKPVVPLVRKGTQSSSSISRAPTRLM